MAGVTVSRCPNAAELIAVVEGKKQRAAVSREMTKCLPQHQPPCLVFRIPVSSSWVRHSQPQ